VNPILKLTYRQWLVVIHDVVATAAAMVMSFWLRFGTWDFLDRFRQNLAFAAGIPPLRSSDLLGLSPLQE
jgi:hypothetical protein